MKKIGGFTKHMVAILLSGMLAVGAIPGTALAAEVQENTVQKEEAITTYAVTLDANSGYFVNEWDDVLGEYIESTEILNKLIPVGEKVTTVPIFETDDKQTQAMVFSGWSLERDGELVSRGDEEYVPVDNCVLYAVWEPEEIPENIDDTDMEESNFAEDVPEDDSLVEQEVTDNHSDNEENIGDTEYFSDDSEDIEKTDSENGNEEEKFVDIIEEGKEEFVRTDAVSNVVASGKCGNNLTWTLDNAGTLTISGTGEMSNWRSVNTMPWSAYTIYSVTIRSGVTSIGDCAFADCFSLTSVTIPNTVTRIGDNAFNGCTNLTNIAIPNSVMRIGECAFLLCTSLTNITIPNSVTSIEHAAFSGCSSLINITIPNSVTSIEHAAFNDCSSLTNITIPNSVTSIGIYAFSYCSNLTGIIIPNNVTSIPEGCFIDCKNLQSVTISESVKTIGDEAFKNCTSLKGITISNSVTSIGERAFEACTSLTSVTISKSVTKISEKAFLNCDNIANVYYKGGKGDWNKIEIGSLNDSLTNGVIHYTFTITEDTWYFHNLNSFIPVYIYEMFFEEAVAKEKQERGNGKGGHCAGMVITASSIYVGYPSIPFWDNKSTLYKVHGSDYTTKTGCTAENFIKYAQTFQYTPEFQKEINNHKSNSVLGYSNLNGLYDAVCDAEHHFGEPVFIGMKKDGGGHALLGYRIVEETNSYTKIAVYDCNEEGQECYLYLYGKRGNYSGWKYGDDWSSNKEKSYISYTQQAHQFIDAYDRKYPLDYSDMYFVLDSNVSGNLHVNNNSYAIGSELLDSKEHDFIPVFSADGSEKDSGYYDFWISSQDPLSITDLSGSGNISLAGGKLEMTVISTEDSSLSMDLSKGKIDISKASDKGVEVKYELSSDYEDSIVTTINGTSDGNTITTQDKYGNIVFSGLKSCNILLQSNHENADGTTTTIDLDREEITNLNPKKKYQIEETGSGDNTCINLNVDNDNNGSYETPIIKAEVIASGSCGKNISWSLSSKGVLTISGTGAIPDYLMDMVPNTPWSYENVKKVVIGDGITRVGNYSFYGMTSLAEARLPSTLSQIGWGAFGDCKNLKTVNIPAGVELIDGIAFHGTAWLAEKREQNPYVIINGILIDGETVSGNEIDIPENVKKIGPYAFVNKVKYTSVNIPEGVESIGNIAFSGNNTLSSVFIPSTVNEIGTDAFDDWKIAEVQFGGTPSQWEKLGISSDNNYSLYTADKKSFTRIDITKAAVTGLVSKTYTSKAITQTPTVEIDSTTLKQNTDYKISYKNNTNAGTATITITGIGDYTGTVSRTFIIARAAQSLSAKASAASVAVGKTITMTASGAKETSDYSYTSSNTKVATVSTKGVVTGKSAGTVTITVKTPQTQNYNAASKTVKITVTANKSLKKPGNCHFAKWDNAKYTSCQIAWNKVAGAEGYQTLLSWTNGTHASATIVKSNVLYRNCTVHPQHVSQMKVRAFYTLGGKRVFGPWSNIEYITPSPTKLTTKNVSNGSNLKMNISWNIIYGCNGYNVFITTNPNGKWYWNQSTSEKATATSATIDKCGGAKLKKNSRYYIRIVTRRKRNGVFCTVPMPASNTYVGSFIIK